MSSDSLTNADSRFQTPADGQKYSIEMQGVFVGYSKKNPILHNVSFEVEKGAIVGVLGNTGAGKSTAIRCLTSQLSPIRGWAKTAGIDVKDKELVKLRIGYVPQLEYLSLYYNFSAEDNALFFGRGFGLSDQEIKSRCKEIMSILGLVDEEFRIKPIKKLSGGERKRVSIMVGLINQPEVLFLDEPTTGLDPHLRIEVLNFLKEINERLKTTILLVSHDLELVDYCSHVMVFEGGFMVDFGNPRCMVQSLPNHGRSLIIKTNAIIPSQEEILSQIDSIIYYLHVGRNTYKIFLESESKLENILNKLKEFNIIPESWYFEHCVFLDYFRVHSTYNYPRITKEMQLKLKSN
jgi:ABC-2 type transport system ATP-binding protein